MCMRRIVVLTSNTGTGSNLQALIDASTTQFDGQIVGVISGKESAPALWRAKQADIPAQVYDYSEYKEAGKPRVRFEEDLAHTLQIYTPDLIVLAGWRFNFSKTFLKFFPWRVINLHPGLLGDKPGEPYRFTDGTAADPCYGLCGETAIQAQLASGAPAVGSTVRVVMPDTDWGPVIERGMVPVQQGESAADAYARLKKKENQIIVQALQELCLPMEAVH